MKRLRQATLMLALAVLLSGCPNDKASPATESSPVEGRAKSPDETAPEPEPEETEEGGGEDEHSQPGTSPDRKPPAPKDRDRDDDGDGDGELFEAPEHDNRPPKTPEE